jgi:4-hydroxybenzoate polyprenyltransferase
MHTKNWATYSHIVRQAVGAAGVYCGRLLYYLFRLSRPINLLLAAFIFTWAAYFSALRSFSFGLQKHYWLELMTLLLIMASGYWINDVFDQRIDQINKPHKTIVGSVLSRKQTLTAYFIAASCALLGTIWFLPFKFWFLNFFAVGVLFFYTSHLKKYAVIGNLAIATLNGLVVLAGGLLLHLKAVHLWGGVFMFTINLLREIIKDIEDIEGDVAYGVRTLPALIGVSAAQRFLAWGYLLQGLLQCVFFILYAMQYNVYNVSQFAFIAIQLFWVVLPLFYSFLRLQSAKHSIDFHRQSQILKWVMISGMLSFLFLPAI